MAKVFKLSSEPVKIQWPVKMDVPQDGGRLASVTWTAVFLAETIEEQRARWTKMNEAVASGDKLSGLKAEDDLLETVFVGWGNDVVGDDEQPLPFNDDTRELMLSIEYRRDAILKAYKLFIEGKKAKN